MRDNKYLKAIIRACDMGLRTTYLDADFEVDQLILIKKRIEDHLRFGDSLEDRFVYLEFKNHRLIASNLMAVYMQGV